MRTKDLPLLEEGSLLADLVSIAGDIPTVALIPKIPVLILKTRGRFREWWTKRGQRELYDLQAMTPEEIAARLPMFWATDLKDFMERENRSVVLFIDTYEALWEARRTEGAFFDRDEWVRELVAQLPGVPWIIAGREKLRWAELDADWQGYMEQHLVGQLAPDDSRRFLVSCGIVDEALQDEIVASSRGVPFYLDLAVDNYQEVQAVRGTVSLPDVRGTPRDVLDRFLRYLDRAETETLKVLSIPRFFDRPLFEALVETFKTGYPATAFAELCRFSFVQTREESVTWTIHPLMREALEEHQDPELRARVHQWLFDRHDHLLLGSEGEKPVDASARRAFVEAFYHGQRVLPADRLFGWFTNTATPFDDEGAWRFLIPLYEELASVSCERFGREHPTDLSMDI